MNNLWFIKLANDVDYVTMNVLVQWIPLNMLRGIQATVVAKLSYASPAWWGLTSAADRDRLESFLRRSTALGFRPATAPTLCVLCSEADDKLFKAITANSSHLLHHLLPPRREIQYSLRPRAHDFTLLMRTTSLSDNNYMNRMLYKNIGCIWLYCNLYFNLTTILCISGLTVTCIKLLLTYLLTYL